MPEKKHAENVLIKITEQESGSKVIMYFTGGTHTLVLALQRMLRGILCTSIRLQSL